MDAVLVDDRGASGEYAHFLRTHRDRLPAMVLEVFCNWVDLSTHLHHHSPELILLDMRFDDGPVEQLAGDLEALAQSARFAGDYKRAEMQLRSLQGVFLLQALRESGYAGPVLLFGSVSRPQIDRLMERFGPLRILEGLLFEGVRDALEWAAQQTHP